MIRIFSAWGNPVMMSEHTLYKTIMKQSKVSNYDWLASADELVDVCNRKGFNRKYAIDIKCAILNCYAVLFYRSEVDEPSGLFIALNDLLDEYNHNKDQTDFNEIESKKIIDACTNFLNSYLYRITFWIHITNISESKHEAARKFRENKIKELLNTDYIDFEALPQIICQEFRKYMDELVANGTVTFESAMIQWEDEELNTIKHYSGSVLDENGTLQNTSKKLVKKPRNNK